MKNWRTTAAGLLFAIGIGISGSPDPVIRFFGIVTAAVGGLLVAVFAKDAKTK